MDDKELLRNVIQLVVLTIPLFFLYPLIKKTADPGNALSSGFSKFAGAIRFDKLLDKTQSSARGGVKKKAAYSGANFSQKVQDGRFGGRLESAATRAAAFRRSRAANKKVREDTLTGRKAARDLDIRNRAGAVIEGAGQPDSSRFAESARRVGGEALYRSAAGAAAKASQTEFQERVSGIQAQLEISDHTATTLGAALATAIGNNDHETSTAIINRLSQMGAGGVEHINRALEAAPVTNTDTQRAVMTAVHASDAVGKYAPQMQKGEGFNAAGEFNGDFNSLSTEQVAGLSTDAMNRYSNQLQADRAAAATPEEEAHAEEAIRNAKAHIAAIQGSAVMRDKVFADVEKTRVAGRIDALNP